VVPLQDAVDNNSKNTVSGILVNGVGAVAPREAFLAKRATQTLFACVDSSVCILPSFSRGLWVSYRVVIEQFCDAVYHRF
jgi:hypothetical protein